MLTDLAIRHDRYVREFLSMLKDEDLTRTVEANPYFMRNPSPRSDELSGSVFGPPWLNNRNALRLPRFDISTSIAPFPRVGSLSRST
jgi:hypothetical protein